MSAAALRAADPEPRRPGRPRDQRVDRAIVAATLDLLADEGYHALTVEAVASRAGVGKATIYRRWSSKKDLVEDCLSSLNAGLPVPPAGRPVRDQLLTLMVHICEQEPYTVSGRIMLRMLAYQSSQPELFRAYLARVVQPRRELTRRVLREGVRTGELRGDIDVELVALALTAPLAMMQRTHPERSLGPADAEALLDLLWPGIAADPSG